ncbi:MAG: DUF4185 domain-containing protein [Pseudonocardiaceae bacterium]
MSGKRFARLVVVGVIGSMMVLAGPAAAQEAPVLGQAQRVALLTGPGSINATDVRYQVNATDLGIIWGTGRGQVLVAFGDTFGTGWTGPGPGVGDQATIDWRSQTLARSADTDLADGMSFDSFATDRPGHAAELIPSQKINGVEISTIPTGGVSIGGRDYLAYMSVRRFGPGGGRWTTNHAGVAYSDDNGQTWVEAISARRPNTPASDDPFQMVAYAQQDGFVYLFGTPNGRFGDAHLARVPPQDLLDQRAYQYWTGEDWQPGAAQLAVPIVPGPVGELSVHYNSALNAWTMMYLDESQGAIVLRAAPQPTGPWGPAVAVATAEEYPALYGGFIHPYSDGAELYFTMTQYWAYNVSLMRVRLTPDLLDSLLPADS